MPSRLPYSGVEGLAPAGTIQLPDDYQHVRADPAAFGADVGQATQALGAGLSRTGGDLSSIAARQNDFERQTAVTQAMNAFQQNGMNQVWGDPNNPQDQGYMGRRGTDAATGWADFAKGVEQSRQDVIGGLNDPVAREMFDRQSRRLAFSFGELGARHRQQQMQEASVAASNAAVTLSQQNGVLQYNDEEAFKNSLADAKRNKATADQAAGVAPDAAELNQRQVESDMVAARVHRMAADNPLVANAYLQQHLGSLLPAQQTALIDGLKAQVKQRSALDIANSHVSDLTNPTAPYVPGPNVVPPEQRDTILDRATSGTMVPKPLLNAVISQESGWDAGRQRAGGSDLGLGQITQSTGADPGYGMEPISREDARDPAKNAAWSARYLEARGKALGLLTPADWNDPSKVSRVLQAYNGGGDPNYVQNVTRRMTGAQITTAQADKGAAAPMQPIQTQADYYRENFERVTEETRSDALAQHPDDPQLADLAVARAQQKMNQAIGAQDKAYRADSDTLWQAANGDLAKGVFPGSVDDLTRISPQVQQAWQRVQVQQPQLAHAIYTRVLSQNAKPDDGKDAKTYGDQFYQQFQRVHAADGDPNKLTNPDDLYGLLGKGLTMAGIEKLRGEITSKRTPEGEAWSSQQAQFFKVAKGSISGTDDGLGLKDPKGEQIYLRFMAQAYPLIERGRAEGKTAAQLFNPESPDYVGKIVPGFRRSLAQRTADMLDAAKEGQAAPAEQPGFFGRLFGGPDLSSPEGIRAALANGKITREEAIRHLTTPRLTPAETE